MLANGTSSLRLNEKTTRRWFWCFLVARGGIEPGPRISNPNNYLRLLTASLNALPAVNLTVLAAGILISAPV